MSRVLISVTRDSLIANLNTENLSDKVITELKIILTTLSPALKYSSNSFILPWEEFKRALVGVSKILKRENIDAEFDDFSHELVNDFLSDRRNVREQEVYIGLQKTDLQKILEASNFKRKLTPQQERDILNLLKLKHGANFSVPGAGKTTALLAVYTVLKHFGIVNKLFVVSPINAFISWEDEIEEIFPKQDISVVRLDNYYFNHVKELININPEVVLVNYEKLRKELRLISPFFYENKVHLVLDESHRIKSGHNNLSFSQIIRLRDISKRRDVLSGTPMPQSYLDLQPQFDFLWPVEKIIPDLTNVKDEDKIATLNKSITPYFVRTTKNELGLSDPLIDYVKIQMGPIQTELYKLFKSESARLMSGMDKINIQNFRKIGRSVVRLLQASTNPMLLGLSDTYMDETVPTPNSAEVWELLNEFGKYEKPEKIEILKRKVSKIVGNNQKVIVWSYFVRNIQLLETVLKEYSPISIYGAVPSGDENDEESREGRIRKFHYDDNCKVMIANPQACGEGISLHKVCHNAIYLDRNFNAAHFLQSIDRIHRLGLSKDTETKVEILFCENTIDEVVNRRLNEKIINMGKALNDKYLTTLAYDPVDFNLDSEDGLDDKDINDIKRHVMDTK